MKYKTTMLIALIFIGFIAIALAISADDPKLTALRSLQIENTTIEAVEYDDDPIVILGKSHDGSLNRAKDVPPRVKIKLTIKPTPESNIRVEVWLPNADKWNGRFVGLGNGGSAGGINSGGFASYVKQDFAAATTDMGTSAGSNCGANNHEVWKDFGFRATHLMTTSAKEVIKAYYGKAPDFSYFLGSSTGGQQALAEAQRYPEDYDGIVGGVPAECRAPLHAYFLWNYQILEKCPFTKEQEAAVLAAGKEFMAPREAPSVAGKIVSDPRCTPEDIEAVIALARQKDSTLTDDHAAALRKLFDGPTHATTGERIFPGIPLGASISGTSGHLYLFQWAFDGKKTPAQVNFNEDIEHYLAVLGPYLNAENPDLTPFSKRGGKLIISSGSADSLVPYHATLDYYERTIEKMGDTETVQKFFRFYIFPGMGHGGSPAGLQHIIDWREKDIAPETLVFRDIPVPPYPQKAAWDAENNSWKSVAAPRCGVPRIAERFLPAAQE